MRSPSGVSSWMMRVQNDPSIFSSTLELSLDDISQLFSPYQGKPKAYDADSMGMIDSESLEEEEYESLYESNFPSVFNDNSCQRQESQPFEGCQRFFSAELCYFHIMTAMSYFDSKLGVSCILDTSK